MELACETGHFQFPSFKRQNICIHCDLHTYIVYTVEEIPILLYFVQNIITLQRDVKSLVPRNWLTFSTCAIPASSSIKTLIKKILSHNSPPLLSALKVLQF